MILFYWYLGDKEDYTFPKSISLKVNVIACKEFELNYLKAAVQLFNHYTIVTSLTFF